MENGRLKERTMAPTDPRLGGQLPSPASTPPLRPGRFTSGSSSSTGVPVSGTVTATVPLYLRQPSGFASRVGQRRRRGSRYFAALTPYLARGELRLQADRARVTGVKLDLRTETPRGRRRSVRALPGRCGTKGLAAFWPTTPPSATRGMRRWSLTAGSRRPDCGRAYTVGGNLAEHRSAFDARGDAGPVRCARSPRRAFWSRASFGPVRDAGGGRARSLFTGRHAFRIFVPRHQAGGPGARRRGHSDVLDLYVRFGEGGQVVMKARRGCGLLFPPAKRRGDRDQRPKPVSTSSTLW